VTRDDIKTLRCRDERDHGRPPWCAAGMQRSDQHVM